MFLTGPRTHGQAYELSVWSAGLCEVQIWKNSRWPLRETALLSTVLILNLKLKRSIQPVVDNEDGFLYIRFQCSQILLQITILLIYTNLIFPKFWLLIEHWQCKPHSSLNLVMVYICDFNGFGQCKCEWK